MIDEDKLDLRTIASIVKAATTGGDTTQAAIPAHRLTFGTEGASWTAETAANAAVEAMPLKAGPPPPDLPAIEAIKLALRAAVRLEFATVPPYLTALWSIIDQAHPVAISIRAIAHEEMLHLSLLCNLLSALGERPSLTGVAVPRCQVPDDWLLHNRRALLFGRDVLKAVMAAFTPGSQAA